MLVSATYCCIHVNNRKCVSCVGFGRYYIWPCIIFVSAADAVRQPVNRQARLMCLVAMINLDEVHVYHLAAMFDVSSLLLHFGFS